MSSSTTPETLASNVSGVLGEDGVLLKAGVKYAGSYILNSNLDVKNVNGIVPFISYSTNVGRNMPSGANNFLNAVVLTIVDVVTLNSPTTVNLRLSNNSGRADMLADNIVMTATQVTSVVNQP